MKLKKKTHPELLQWKNSDTKTLKIEFQERVQRGPKIISSHRENSGKFTITIARKSNLWLCSFCKLPIWLHSVFCGGFYSYLLAKLLRLTYQPQKYWAVALLGCLLISAVIGSVPFSSVAQSSPTLCDPTDCSMPGLPVHHQLPELAQTHVHWVGDALQPSHPLSFPSPPAFNLSQHHGLFR